MAAMVTATDQGQAQFRPWNRDMTLSVASQLARDRGSPRVSCLASPTPPTKFLLSDGCGDGVKTGPILCLARACRTHPWKQGSHIAVARAPLVITKLSIYVVC